MTYRGIEKGDKDFRHFTYDGSIITRAGVPYYKVTYGKNSLEGEYAEDEIGYVECSKLIPVGKRPNPPAQQEIKPVAKSEPVVQKQEVKHRGRPKKVQTEQVNQKNDETYPVEISTSSGLFEYKVNDIDFSTPDDLQDILNEEGNDGWELCGFNVNNSFFGGNHILVIFKKCK